MNKFEQNNAPVSWKKNQKVTLCDRLLATLSYSMKPHLNLLDILSGSSWYPDTPQIIHQIYWGLAFHSFGSLMGSFLTSIHLGSSGIPPQISPGILLWNLSLPCSPLWVKKRRQCLGLGGRATNPILPPGSAASLPDCSHLANQFARQARLARVIESNTNQYVAGRSPEEPSFSEFGNCPDQMVRRWYSTLLYICHLGAEMINTKIQIATTKIIWLGE